MPQSKRAAKQQALFMRRSYSAYRDIRKRAGLLEDLPYTLAELREEVRKALEQGECPYLAPFGVLLTVKNFSLDHRTPLSRGGEEELFNLIVCSRSANLAKGVLTEQEFRKMLKVLETMPEEASRDVIGRLKAGAAVIRLKFLGGKKE
jgi:5-methylcytosine-specific restriction endonuclease McrA